MSSYTTNSAIHGVFLVFAVCIAYGNNRKGERGWPVVCAVLVPEFYLLQFLVRYFIFQEEGYGLKNSSGFLRERPAGRFNTETRTSVLKSPVSSY